MNTEWEEIRSRPVIARLFEKRCALLTAFLREHGLADPKSVEYSPLVGCIESRCFINVDAQVKRAGGRLETGWVFWEYENISIYTEAHGIWITPQNKRMDITPRSFPPERRILFLPDARVAAKRGYTAGYRTIISTDVRVRAVESFMIELDRIFEDSFSGFKQEIVIPTSRVKEVAQLVGLPTDVAKQIFENKVQDFRV